jgi:hypothetical protein
VAVIGADLHDKYHRFIKKYNRPTQAKTGGMMAESRLRYGIGLLTTVLVMVFVGAVGAHAQSEPQIKAPIDEFHTLALKGDVNPLARAEFDQGRVDASKPSGRLLLVLKRSANQEAALQQYLKDAHSTAASTFHKWLTPEQFGQKFGPADADVQALSGWLQGHGLSVAKVSKGRSVIEFTGTIGQVEEAFHTSIHSYNANGKVFHANATDPKIPAALQPVIAGVSQLNDIPPKPLSKLLGKASYTAKQHEAHPRWTEPGTSGSLPYYLLTPEDFATQYDVNPVYTSGVKGTGQAIGIINDSNIDVSIVNAYRALFGLPVNPPQVVVDGNDPGITGDATEAYLDVENAGAVAPNATVILYTAGSYGLLGGGGINFSLVRAVEDDAASVLSLSFGSCEQSLGNSGNALINSIWEQAAAQGQTALVSSGDTGSAGCDYNGSSAASYGLAVNGLASTPWNIAVGGTDFYYSDYASGGGSIANYWSSSNDSKGGSLQKPIPEQPWNESNYGFNIVGYDPLSNQEYTTAAGGGGVSSCSQSVTDSNGNVTCQAGYSKPVWQTGTGVPADGARDIPDVSLFSAGGANGAAWITCVYAGDCVADSTGSATVEGVGGTSASAPTMAGIMALINEKYGPQGQANFVLYPLAAKSPVAFKAVDIGSNNVPCYPDSANCSLDSNGDGLYSLQNYSGKSGYDLASGLGSIDVNALLTNWKNVSFDTTSTTLSLTPTSIKHGQNITAAVSVTSPSGTPSGGVTLLTTSPLPANKSQTILTLDSKGTAQGVLNYLPGGTYSVYGQYGGDGIFGLSKSSPATVTVTPEDTNLNLSVQDSNGQFGSYVDLANGAKIPFGTNIIADINPTGVSAPTGQSNGAATGTATFLDGSTTLATTPISSESAAEYATRDLAIGSHSLVVKYSGDASFNSAASTPITFTVTKSDTFAFFETAGAYYYNGYPAGQPYVFTVAVDASSFGYVPPTGTITFQLDGGSLTSATLANGNGILYGTMTWTNPTIGSHSLIATYSGDSNYNGSTVSKTYKFAAATELTTTTNIAITSPSDPSKITPSTPVTLTATVQGGAGSTTPPTGQIVFADLYFYTLSPVTLKPGTGATATASVTILPAQLASGDYNLITATYGGNSLYEQSTSSAVDVYNDASDFSVTPLQSNIVVKSGATGTVDVNLVPVSGFTGAVSLKCVAPTGLTCSLSQSSVVLSATTSTQLTINAFTTSSTASVQGLHPYGWFGLGGGGAVLAACLLFAVPRRRRLYLLLVSTLVLPALFVGCGGGGGGSKQPAAPTQQNVAAGTYHIVVSGTAPSGTTHNTQVTVIVQ